MIANIKNYLIQAGVFIIIFLLTFFFGCQHGKKIKVCPTITTTTITVHDTVPHEIPTYYPWYIKGDDSIVYVHDSIPIVIDSAEVIKDYYAQHYSSSQFEDSLLLVNESYMLTQNKYYPIDFKYKYKGATTIINNSVDNSTNYARYIYLGASLPVFPAKANTISNINYIGLNGLYAFPKGYAEIIYQPYTKIFTLGAGVKLFKFK